MKRDPTERLNKTAIIHDPYHFEKRLWNEGFHRVMGLDEVGRGCLAGPVVAAGVILDPGHRVPGITDSKKLGPAQRTVIAEEIRRHSIFWTVASCDIQEIDSLNILKASLRAMEKCVERAEPAPDFLLIDGNKSLKTMIIPSQTIIKGDDLSVSIGAASILAKVYRDGYMSGLHQQFPEFGWDKNVGYPTAFHYEALRLYGFTPHHRTTFRLRTKQPYREE